MRDKMCAQIEVLKKIRKAGKMNGYATELAEAQAEDFMAFRKEFKESMKSVMETQIKQGAQLDLIVKYINSPADQERKDGLVWTELKKLAQSPLGRLIIVLFIFCLGLAGQRIMELTGLIK